MFNFGSDDKEELQENMQEIKGMIQGDNNRQSDSGFDGLDGFDQNSSGNNQGYQQGMNQGGEQNFSNNSEQNDQGQNNQIQGMNQQSSQDFGNEDNQDNFSGNNNSSMNQGGSQTGTDDFDPFAPDEDEQMESQVGQKVKVPGQSNTGPTNQQNSPDNGELVDADEEDNSSSERSEESISRNVRNTRRNPQERNQDSKKLDRRPSADEPLFLKEENFVDVREMIEEMGYLARELQENLDEMKETVHKEKEYARDAQEVVNAYSDRRGDIEDIIRTGQK